jgi:hypothetical protein
MILSFIKKQQRNLIGLFIGAIAGWMYWNFVGCSSGSCAITSKPINSTLYGAFMGYLIMGMFQKNVK